MTSGLFSGYTGMTDSYIVFSQPIEIGYRSSASANAVKVDGKVESLRPVRAVADAAYVDGVANVNTSNKFWGATRYDSLYTWETYKSITYNGVEYTKTSTYTITLMPGLQRYTSLEKMNPENNEYARNNDFSAWNPDVWTIVDGVPTFKSITVNDYIYLANDVPISENGAGVEAGKSFDVTVELDGAETGIKPKLEVITVDGVEDVVSVSGNRVTGLAKGSQNVKVIYGSSEHIFTVTVTPAPVDLETQYYFSAHDGQFYDDNFNVVPLTTVFALDIDNVLSVTDAKDNPLELTAKNTIMGLNLGKQTTWAENSITIATVDLAYRVSILGADAIIDEASDLAVLTPQATGTVTKDSISYDGDDFEDDGYYVVVKDIVANQKNAASGTGYTHNYGSKANFNPITPSMETIKASGLGFSGVFDGQGHSISNLWISRLPSGDAAIGLFSWINGGTVKNLSLINICSHNSGSNGIKPTAGSNGVAEVLFATYLIDATIEDLYIEFGRCQGSDNRLLYKNADSDTTITRVYMQHTSYHAFNTNGSGLFANSSAELSDVYWVSILPVNIAGAPSKTTKNLIVNKTDGSTKNIAWAQADGVAEIIDGDTQPVVKTDENGVKYTTVENVYDSGATSAVCYSVNDWYVYKSTTDPGDTSKAITAYDAVIYSGIKQYTTLDGFKTAALNGLDFSSWTNWTVSSKGVLSLRKV